MLGAGAVDALTETCVSELTLDGANATVAFESALETVPPVVGETIAGGERPLAVLAVGSGGVVVLPVAGVVVGLDDEVWVVWAPTSTVVVPVPVPVPVAGGVVVVAGAGVVVDAAALELPVVVLVSGTVVPVPLAGTVTFCDPAVDEPEVPEFDVPLVFVVDGTVRFGSVGASWLLETGGAAEVSVVVAGAVDVVFVELFEFDAVDEAAVEACAFNWALS